MKYKYGYIDQHKELVIDVAWMVVFGIIFAALTWYGIVA